MNRGTRNHYRWIWRRVRTRHEGAKARATLAFLRIVGTDLLRATLLTVARVTTLVRRRVESTPRHVILEAGGRCVGAAGFCLLLFAPLAVTVLAAQAPASRATEGGEIALIGAGMVMLDGVPTHLDELRTELAARGTRSVTVSLSRNTPVHDLTELRSAFEGTSVRRVRMEPLGVGAEAGR